MKKILLLSLAIVSGCATGSHVATGNLRPAISAGQVRIYNSPPAKFETVGTVEARAHITVLGHGSASAKAVSKLKYHAAKIGANGVLLSSATEHDEHDDSVRISGTAIFVP